MQTIYDLLPFKVYFNSCKVQGHHLHLKRRLNQLPIKSGFQNRIKRNIVQQMSNKFTPEM